MSEKQSGSASRTMFIGAATALASCLLMPLPIVTGAKIGRFIFLIALIGFLLGSCIAFNGLIDRWRGGGGA